MKLVNQIGFDTRFGYKTIELHQGDITDATADLLVISAFAGSYEPLRGTMIESLEINCGVKVREYERHAALDLRPALGVWLSEPVTAGPFGRFLGVELYGGTNPVSESIENVFVAISILEAKGCSLSSVAMPVLGAGAQGIAMDIVIPPLLKGAQQVLERSASLSKVMFIERDPVRVLALDTATNSALARVAVKLPKGLLLDSLRQDVLTALGRMVPHIPSSHQHLVDELRRKLSSDDIRSFEMGILGRRVAEFITDSLLTKKKTSPELWKRIDSLSELKVAPWIQTYLHTLRILGNEGAHEKSSEGRIPGVLEEADVALCLFCIQRVTVFFEEYQARRTRGIQEMPRGDG